MNKPRKARTCPNGMIECGSAPAKHHKGLCCPPCTRNARHRGVCSMSPRRPKATVTVVLTEEERDQVTELIKGDCEGDHMISPEINPGCLLCSVLLKLRRARVARQPRRKR